MFENLAFELKKMAWYHRDTEAGSGGGHPGRGKF